MSKQPNPGDRAPAFTLPRDGGGTCQLTGHKGKTVVLYFYPKDDTPGCTTEAVDFSARKSAFTRAGAVVIGISKDTPAKHDKFIEKHGLKLILASDEDGEVLEKYGVWVEKMNYGRKYMGIQRATFLIDPKGRIAQVWPKVRVKGHADDVLQAVKAL